MWAWAAMGARIELYCPAMATEQSSPTTGRLALWVGAAALIAVGIWLVGSERESSDPASESAPEYREAESVAQKRDKADQPSSAGIAAAPSDPALRTSARDIMGHSIDKVRLPSDKPKAKKRTFSNAEEELEYLRGQLEGELGQLDFRERAVERMAKKIERAKGMDEVTRAKLEERAGWVRKHLSDQHDRIDALKAEIAALTGKAG